MQHMDEASNNPFDMQDVDETNGQEKDGDWFEASPDAQIDSESLVTPLPDTPIKPPTKKQNATTERLLVF